MKQYVGKVIEVFLKEPDNIDCETICFRIQTDDGIKEIEKQVNGVTADIMKDDKVIITEQTIDNRVFIDIDRCEENYE